MDSVSRRTDPSSHGHYLGVQDRTGETRLDWLGDIVTLKVPLFVPWWSGAARAGAVTGAVTGITVTIISTYLRLTSPSARLDRTPVSSTGLNISFIS